MFTVGGMAVFGIGGLFGYQVADIAGRWYEGLNPANYQSSQGGTATGTTTTTPPALPSGITTVQQYNEVVQGVPPTLMRSLIQFGVSAVGFLVGAFAPWPLLKLAGYGWGFGALFKVAGDLITGYVIRPMFVASGAGTSSATLSNMGQVLYQHEQTAANAQATAASQSGGTPLGAPPARQLERGGTKVPPASMQARPVVLARTAEPRGLGAPAGPFQASPFAGPGSLSTALSSGAVGSPSSGATAGSSDATSTMVPGPAPSPGSPGSPPAGSSPPMNTAPPGSSVAPSVPASSACAPCGEPPEDDDQPHPMVSRRLLAVAPQSTNRYPGRRVAA